MMSMTNSRSLTIKHLLPLYIAALLLFARACCGANWFEGLPTTVQSSILWKATHESGGTCEWNDASCKPWASGSYSYKIVTTPVHSGRYALSSTINTSREDSGVRWPRRWVNNSNPRAGLPTDAYYSCWIYMPVKTKSAWYNQMQWKSNRQNGRDLSGSDPCWNVGPRMASNGKMYLYVHSHIGTDGGYNTRGSGDKGTGTFEILPARWYHLEARYMWRKDKTGKLQVWLDGVKQFDFSNIQTQFNRPDAEYPRQWAVNAYASQVSPNPHTLIIDDAAISSVKLYQ